MKFTAKEDFKHGLTTFEAGNVYDSGKHGLFVEEVRYFHRVGWASIDGEEDQPRDTRKRTLAPHNAAHAATDTGA